MSKRPETPHSRERYHPWSTYIAAREEARRLAREPGPEHVLAEILELQRPDPAAELLATLGARPDTIRESHADV